MAGEIDNEPPVVKTSSYSSYPRTNSSVIQLPDHTRHSTLLPSAQDRFKMIRACKAAGIDVGVKVIRVNNINKYYVENPTFIGEVTGFLMSMYPGHTEYRPILVRFTVAVSGWQDMPFLLRELETLENAKNQVEETSNTPRIIQSLQDGVIQDLMRQRSGVLPFRNPNTFYH